MEISDKLENSEIVPAGLNLKEKAYYLTAQANAIMLPLSALYATFGDNPKAGILATGVNALLTYVGVKGMKDSYNQRNGEEAMKVEFPLYAPRRNYFDVRKDFLKSKNLRK